MTRRIYFQTDNGLAVVAIPVDPALESGEIEIFPDPRGVAREIGQVAISDLLERCR